MEEEAGIMVIRQLALAIANDIVEDMFGSDPLPVDVIHNGPATIVFFDDGTKVVSKCSEEDYQDDGIGTLTCCVRKAMRNRRFDHLDHLIKASAVMLRTPEAVTEFADALCMYAETMMLEEE